MRYQTQSWTAASQLAAAGFVMGRFVDMADILTLGWLQLLCLGILTYLN